jgi:hypothetical protein
VADCYRNIHRFEEDVGTFLLRCQEDCAILKFESSKPIPSFWECGICRQISRLIITYPACGRDQVIRVLPSIRLRQMRSSSSLIQPAAGTK